MKCITLTQGKVAIVDDADYSLLLQVSGKWCAARARDAWYAMGHLKGTAGGRSVKMHRVILGAAPWQHVDHRNGNGLDNRLANLRIATRQQNGWNRGALKSNTSGFKGANKHHSGRWIARITVDRKRIFLGLFDSASEAGKAYAMAAKKYHQEFART